MINRHISDTLDIYKDMYNYFRYQNVKAVHLLQQCCLSNISKIMNNRDINDTIDTYKDMYRYFRHQSATELQGC